MLLVSEKSSIKNWRLWTIYFCDCKLSTLTSNSKPGMFPEVNFFLEREHMKYSNSLVFLGILTSSLAFMSCGPQKTSQQKLQEQQDLNTADAKNALAPY